MSKNNFISLSFDDLHLLFIAFYEARRTLAEIVDHEVHISDLRIDIHADGTGFVLFGKYAWPFDWRSK